MGNVFFLLFVVILLSSERGGQQTDMVPCVVETFLKGRPLSAEEKAKCCLRRHSGSSCRFAVSYHLRSLLWTWLLRVAYSLLRSVAMSSNPSPVSGKGSPLVLLWLGFCETVLNKLSGRFRSDVTQLWHTGSPHRVALWVSVLPCVGWEAPVALSVQTFLNTAHTFSTFAVCSSHPWWAWFCLGLWVCMSLPQERSSSHPTPNSF